MTKLRYEEVVALYDKLIATIPQIERKGKNMPYTSNNGYMFGSVTNDGRVGIRLSAEDREEFSYKYGAKQFINYNSKIKEHVEIPESLLHDTKTLSLYLKKSLEYTNSLKPK